MGAEITFHSVLGELSFSMSHKHQLLLNAVFHQLRRTPSCPLGDLSRELCVSRRTLQNAINIITGNTFRDLRDELLVERVKSILESHPTLGIKELSFELGFKFPRSFARAIKRACGFSPAQLRSRIIFQLLQDEKQAVSPDKGRDKKEVGRRIDVES